MTNSAISMVSRVEEYSVGPILRGVRSFFCFNQFIGDIGNVKAKLESKLEQVKERQEEAARKNEEITPPVKKWLDDVEAILQEVQTLQQNIEEGGKNFFNMSLRHSLTKQMENKAKQMMELKKNSNFEPFSHPIQLSAITHFSSKEFVEFDSRKSTHNHLLEAIRDGKNKMVGLYGMWGSGKTTLAKEGGKKVVELKLYDKVVVVHVSKTAIVEDIQREIAEQIGLEIQERDAFRIIWNKLQYWKILIILDDVWSKLSLTDIGIPLDKGCRIIITTRLGNLCDSMNCDSKIELPLLTKEEAWTLLKMHANITNNSSNEFDDVGRQIVDECKGLPMTVVAVGSTLKGKRIEGWVTALWRLQHSQPMDVEEDLRIPYACMKLNYDNLPSSAAKSLFLLCSMFPEDHKINKEDLVRFGKAMLRLDESVDTMEDVRREILLTINKLMNSHLLMPTYKPAYVKLHDVVRDAALLIAKKRHKAVLVERHEVSKMLVGSESVKDTKVISFWNLKNTFKLSNQLRCPTLEILLLHPKEFIEDFGGVEALKVLALIQSSFIWCTLKKERTQWTMPQSIVTLTNLHSLCLRGNALGDISFLGKLKQLEIMDLRGSSFSELPAGIVDMKMLKLLDVFGCLIEKHPYDVIRKCEQLQELYLWDVKSSIPENFSISGLQRYVICDSTCNFSSLGSPLREYLDGCVEALKALSIKGSNVSALCSSMKDLILRADILWLENCKWHNKDVNPKIKHLVVSRCPERRVIVDNLDANNLQTEQVFSHLITLILIEMDGLEQVFQVSSISWSLQIFSEDSLENFSVSSPNVCFPQLSEIKIGSCNKVKWMFSYSMAFHCPSLEILHIHDCCELDGVVEGLEIEVADDDRLLFPKLNNLTLRRLPKLRQIFPSFEYSESQKRNENDRGVQVVNSKLSNLHLEELPELEYIWKSPTQILSLSKLEQVTLEECPKLRTIFSLAIIPSLPELRELRVRKCNQWEGIIFEESLKNLSASSPNVCFPKLSKIRIEECKKVKWMFSYSLASHCPSLALLQIEDCSALEGMVEGEADELEATHVHTYPGSRLLLPSKLNRLYLKRLPKLRQIFPDFDYKEPLHHTQNCPNKDENDRVGVVVHSELCRLGLENLPELEHIWKGPTQIVSLHRLEDVRLSYCSRLTTIFTSAIVTSLPELRSLHITYCNEWEGIFPADTVKNLSASSPINVCFPKLSYIVIEYCNKVKWVFSYALACHCPSLEAMWLTSCSELEGVVEGFRSGSEVAANTDRPLPLFPNLRQLSLWGLPKMREIYPGYDFDHNPLSIDLYEVRKILQEDDY